MCSGGGSGEGETHGSLVRGEVGDGRGKELHASIAGILLQHLDPQNQQFESIYPQLHSGGRGGVDTLSDTYMYDQGVQHKTSSMCTAYQ